MAIMPYLIELVAKGNFRDDYCLSCFEPVTSVEERLPIPKRERLIQEFPWLAPGQAGIREWHVTSGGRGKGFTTFVILAMGNEEVPHRIPTGEFITIRRGEGEVFYSEDHIAFYVTENAAEKPQGSWARDILAHRDGLDGAPSLYCHLWPAVVSRIEEEVLYLKGEDWVSLHDDKIAQTITAKIRNVALSTLEVEDIPFYAMVVIEQIVEAGESRHSSAAESANYE